MGFFNRILGEPDPEDGVPAEEAAPAMEVAAGPVLPQADQTPPPLVLDAGTESHQDTTVSEESPAEPPSIGPTARATVEVAPVAVPDPSVGTPQQPYRSYGDPARLRPVPRTVAKQVGDPFEEPADTVIEWLDAGGLSVRAVSVRGHVHRYEGDVRQDSLALGDFGGLIWVAVADGVGSRPHSHLGSRLATAAAVASKELLTQARQALHGSDQLSEVTLGSLGAEMEAQARHRGLDPQDLACTLVVAAIQVARDESGSTARAVVWQLGDSCFARMRDGHMELRTRVGTEGDLINSSTSALPSDLSAFRWVEELRSGDTLALVTDGVSNIVTSTEEFAIDLASLWVDAAPTPAALIEVVDASVKSYDDDRTFVGVRVG